jgi:hypothetical protein
MRGLLSNAHIYIYIIYLKIDKTFNTDSLS